MSILSRFKQYFTSSPNQDSSPVTTEEPTVAATPIVFDRKQHRISRKQINENALNVLYRLRKAGFSAYLVGGGVRDLLLQRVPKDFDVATNAHPEQIRRVFRNSRLIGRRFRLAHILYGRDIIEVATFRAHHTDNHSEQQAHIEDGQIIRDNVYGTIEEDAQRRDFSINALYYSINDYSVIDFNNGMADIKAGIIRILGDPEQRYREDPVRMLRAIRFAVKMGFKIEPKTEKPLFTHNHLLKNVPKARLFEEICKLFSSGQALTAFQKLEHYQMLPLVFPLTHSHINSSNQKNNSNTVLYNRRLIDNMFINTDERIAMDKPVTPAFFLAVLLWPALQEKLSVYQNNMPLFTALDHASQDVLSAQLNIFSIQKRFTFAVRAIWQLQYQLVKRHRAPQLIAETKFRAGYDFLLLRVQSGEDDLAEIANWWTDYQHANEETKQAMLSQLPGKKRRRRKRRKRKSTHHHG